MAMKYRASIEPGRHRLQVDNTWNWKNVEFNAAPGEHVRFQTVNRGGRFTWFLVGTLGVGPMYVSHRTGDRRG